MPIGQREVIAHFRSNQQLADELIRRWEHLDGSTRTHLDSIRNELKHARLELAAAYLLELSAPALERAEQLTGFRGFSRHDPLKAMDHEHHVLESTIAKIEADERWVRRQYLVGNEGEYTRELAEAQSMLDPWEHECAKFESLEMFLELVEVKYDTDEFEEWWYQPKYWKHWAAGDRICNELGMDDFGDDVLPAYWKVRAPRDQWRVQVAAVESKIDQVHDLVRRRDEAEARIPQLPMIYLKSCLRALGEFFERADLGLLEEWLEDAGGDRGVQQVLRRVAGLSAKVTFLNEMLEGIRDKRVELGNRRAKFGRKITKYQRDKYWGAQFHETVLDRKFQAKREKYLSQPEKLGQQAERLIRFGDYAAFDLNNQPELWWVFMVRKSPSRYTPRLRSWYERNPQAAPELDVDESLEEAVLTAARTLEDQTDRGYLS